MASRTSTPPPDGPSGWHSCSRTSPPRAACCSPRRARCSSTSARAREVVETDAAIATSLLTGGRCEAAAELAADAAARATALEAGYLQPWLLRLEGAALADAGHPDRAEAVLSRALVLAGTQNRIELGFILAELAALARRRSDPTAANDLARRSQDALRELGFVGSARYPCT